MHTELEDRLRAARDGLGAPEGDAGTRALAHVVASARPGRMRRLAAVLAGSRLRTFGAATAVTALIAVFAVLFVVTRSDRRSSPAGPPVTVPTVTGMPIEAAYDALREAGLTVTIRQWTDLRPTNAPQVATQSPAAGETAPSGSAVVLQTLRPPVIGTPVLVETPEYPAEDFSGKTMTEAVEWARSRKLNWAVRLVPPLENADAPRLLDNYRVGGQRPAPGEKLWGAKTATKNGTTATTGGPVLELRPAVDVSVVPRIEVPALRFRDQAFDGPPLSTSHTGPVRSLRDRRGSVTAIVFTDPDCRGCPADPTTPVPGLSQEDSFAPRYLLSIGRLRRQPSWNSNLQPFWRYAETDAVDLAAELSVGNGTAVFADRLGRVAAVIPDPVDPAEAARIVEALRAEPPPSLADLGVQLSRFEGKPLPGNQIPPDVARVAPGGPERAVYELTRIGETRVFGWRESGGDVAHGVWSPEDGLTDYGSTPPETLAEKLAAKGGVIPISGGGRGGLAAGFVIRPLFLLEDGFTEAVIDGTTYPIDGNAFVFQGNVREDAVWEFRGPGRSQRVDMVTR